MADPRHRPDRAPNTSTGPIIPRLLNAILLRREFYDAVAADPRATGPAGAIVCIAAIIRESVSLYHLSQESGAWGLILVLIVTFAIVRWLAYATVMYPIARAIGRKPLDYKRLLRCLGFAETPVVLFLLAYAVPEQLASFVLYGVTIWLVLATIVAVRSATEVSTERAAVIGVVGFAAYLALGALTRAPSVVESAPPPAALTLREGL